MHWRGLRRNDTRRDFLRRCGIAAAGLWTASRPGWRPAAQESAPAPDAAVGEPASRRPVTLFLCGDVMTGRGIDQILPHPSDPRLFEPWVKNAGEYVALAERAHGAIRKPVDFAYVWGDALAELERVRPDARIVNLETAVTTSGDHWPGKAIHYRMNPANLPCLTALRIDCCVVANNHVLDWGRRGLLETLTVLAQAQIKTAGAGRNRRDAEAPAVLAVAGKGRVLVLGLADRGSGAPSEWAATEDRPGVNLLADLSPQRVRRIAEQVKAWRRPGDVVVASIHWGGNWGYGIPGEQRELAHRLIDEAGVDVVHGHSSHHPKGIEVYRGKPVFYGCGDLLTDYEGIAGHEEYRGDLALLYLVTLDPSVGKLVDLSITPLQCRRFRLRRPSSSDVAWLHRVLSRESGRLGTTVERTSGDRFSLRWS